MSERTCSVQPAVWTRTGARAGTSGLNRSDAMHSMTRRGTQARHAPAVLMLVVLVALLAGCSGSSAPPASHSPSTAAATATATATTGLQPALAYVHLPAGYRATLLAL